MQHYPDTGGERPRWTLRKVVLAETGQDVFRCHGCGTCNPPIQLAEMDISLDSMIQLILQNDEEVLTCRTIWSDEILQTMQYACQRGLDLRAVIRGLRQEAIRRELIKGLDS